MLLTRDALAAAMAAGKVFAYKDVEVPGVDGVLRVREVTVAARSQLVAFFKEQQSGAAGHGPWEFKMLMVALSLCDAHGGRLYPEGQEASLADLPSNLLDRIYDAAAELNGMKEDSAAKIGKNSESSRSSDSGSGSPDTSDGLSPSSTSE